MTGAFRHWVLGLATGALLVAGCGRQAARQAASPEPFPTPPEVVAQWKGARLTRGRLEQRVRAMLAASGLRPGPEAERVADRFRRQEVRGLVGLVLLQEHHSTSPRQLPRSVEEEVGRRWEQAIRKRGEDKLRESLKLWNLTEAQLREELRLEVLRDLYLESLAHEEPVAEEFVRREYEQNRHLYRVPDRYHLLGIVARTREEAERARAELLAGREFGQVARKYSTDARTASRGGEVGWLEDTRMQPWVLEMVRRLRSGELSPVFAGPGGWYVVRVVEVRPGRPLSYEEARPRIVRDFQLQAARITLQALVSRLWREKGVQVYWPQTEPAPSPAPSP